MMLPQDVIDMILRRTYEMCKSELMMQVTSIGHSVYEDVPDLVDDDDSSRVVRYSDINDNELGLESFTRVTESLKTLLPSAYLRPGCRSRNGYEAFTNCTNMTTIVLSTS